MPAALLTDLAAYWPLTETSGNRADVVTGDYGMGEVIQDGAGGLTLAYGTLGYTAGIIGNAPAFNGTTFLTNGDLDFYESTQVSISMWVKGGINVRYNLFGQYGNSSIEQGFLLYSNPDIVSGYPNKVIFLVGGSAQIATATALTNTSAWYHIAATFNAGAMKLYLNGALSSSATASITSIPSGAQLCIGDTTQRAIATFVGAIDEVGVWGGRTLTATEVTTLYNGGKGMTYPS
jgi:hypothetical protein